MKYLVIIFLLILLIILVLHCYKNLNKPFPIKPIKYNNFLSKSEIDLLLKKCQKYNKSTVYQNGKLVIDTQRTSTTCFIDINSPEHNMIRNKIKKIFNIDNQIETLQLTRYFPGQYYKPHYDYFNDKKKSKSKQRMKTIFVYLKCPEEGGETHFPLLNKKFSPKEGDAVMWTNCINQNGNHLYVKESLHAGTPVKKGEKIGLNIWILDKI